MSQRFGSSPPPGNSAKTGSGKLPVGGTGIEPGMVTTGESFEGYRIIKYLGLVRGISIRSRSLVGNIGAGFQAMVGGKTSLFVELCENTRAEATQGMLLQAVKAGANAVIGTRYETNELAEGIAEVLSYGTAVLVEPVNRPEG
jgi:uncharacterized protein YbjQ (UPF0145 family)